MALPETWDFWVLDRNVRRPGNCQPDLDNCQPLTGNIMVQSCTDQFLYGFPPIGTIYLYTARPTGSVPMEHLCLWPSSFVPEFHSLIQGHHLCCQKKNVWAWKHRDLRHLLITLLISWQGKQYPWLWLPDPVHSSSWPQVLGTAHCWSYAEFLMSAPGSAREGEHGGKWHKRAQS